MNAQEKSERAAFAALYHDEAREITILSGEDCEGAGRAGKALIWSANCDIIAYKDGDQVHHEEGSVSWPANDAELESDNRPRFRDLTLYRLRVCPHKTAPHYFRLLDILAADTADRELETIRSAYQQAITWQEAPFAPFVLNKKFNTYNGEGEWLGHTIRLALDSDDEQERPHRRCYRHPAPPLRRATGLARPPHRSRRARTHYNRPRMAGRRRKR